MKNPIQAVGPGLIADFLRDMLRVRRRAENTLESYASDLLQFCRYLAGEIGPLPLRQEAPDVLLVKAESAVLNDFPTYLALQRYRGSTICRKVASLRSFYNWALRNGHVGDDPTANLRAAINWKNRRQTAFLTDSDITKLYAASTDGTLRSERARMVVAICVEAGLSDQELQAIQLQDFVLSLGVLRVRRRGGVRQVRLSDVAIDAVGAYLSARATHLENAQSDALLITKDGERISPRSIRRGLDVVQARAGVAVRVTARSLRNTYVIRCVAAGQTPQQIRDVLGLRSTTCLNFVRSLSKGVAA